MRHSIGRGTGAVTRYYLCPIDRLALVPHLLSRLYGTVAPVVLRAGAKLRGDGGGGGGGGGHGHGGGLKPRPSKKDQN
jgi:hypothetical protein